MSTLADVILRDIAANRPAAGTAGRLFYDTTNSKMQRDNGATWDDVAETASGDVATDAIWDAAGDLAVGSGANTAARLAIGAAGGAVSRINGAVAWNSGTANPTAVAGDRYWRTDLGLEIYYDGTRWLSTTQYRAVMSPFANTLTGNQVSARMVGPSSSGYAWWLERVEWTAYVTTTNTGTQYWTGQLQSWDGATGPTTIGSAMSTISLAADAYLTLSTSPATSIAATVEELEFAYTKVSTAGTLIVVGPTVVYRLIVT